MSSFNLKVSFSNNNIFFQELGSRVSDRDDMVNCDVFLTSGNFNVVKCNYVDLYSQVI